MYGGYCFLNNAAVAAQGFRDSGMERVAVLDVDSDRPDAFTDTDRVGLEKIVGLIFG